jgi:hypothetical protein
MKKTLNTITTPEHNYKAALISVYFGKFPYYFELTKKSAKFNKDFKWLIFTDQVKKRTVEGNLEFLPYNLDSLNKDVAALFKENLHISTNEMVCDTKVLWGELFHKYTKPFPWYGFTDLDCIYGDFDYFLPDEAFENYELITYRMSDGSLHGPLTLFKNTAKMRKLYTEIPDLKGMLSQGKRVESPDEKHLWRIITKK